MKLEIPLWTHHHNQLIYSFYYFCLKEKIKVDISINKSIPYNGALIYYNKNVLFFDYSDDSKLIDEPSRYDYYFKRSLSVEDEKLNVYPLNFNVGLTYNSLSLLMKLNSDIFFNKSNRIEIIRALDRFSLFTNSSHNIMDIKRYPNRVTDSGGKVIFCARLWNPDNHPDLEEKERRSLQNEFRINACRIIKKHFKNSSVGLYPDQLSINRAPDIVLSLKEVSKKTYFKNLANYNIGVADDGLKDTPGWKIGEYLLFGKAVISTPLNIAVNDFKEDVNYLKLSSRSSYEELPDKIEDLLKNKKYLEMSNNNLKWGREYLHPINYIKRILSIVDSKIIT